MNSSATKIELYSGMALVIQKKEAAVLFSNLFIFYEILN
ncbi:hypothetical protein SAMN05444682_10428 [Parapedobacter indicus]|uniref:Uncharacterized protein n=1 Tax=Parapedobacter indicus TaxID=1477437 RepID=A0A1I3IC72_9SPHI|nr:hypothetical protein CLV26_10428 [Parapedobacter indicus]SFI45536.1 hypothetical protein SAMN05444682_10428 [Parapedobacter indicus]